MALTYQQIMAGGINPATGQPLLAGMMPAPSNDKYAGQPADPTYNGWTDPSGNLIEKYKLAKAGDITAASNIEELKRMLADPSMSAWGQLMLQKQGVEEGAALDKTAAGANTSAAAARATLAGRGGASKAAQERLAMKASMADMFGRQDVRRQGTLDRFNVGIADEEQKLKKTGLWANMADSEAGRKLTADTGNRDYASKVDSFNIQNALGGIKSKQDFDAGMYGEKMKAWAADRTATAQENAGKK